MKNARNSIIALALTALSAGSVFAADMTPKTRDQVRAELAQAQRDGTLMVRGDPVQLHERLRQGGVVVHAQIALEPDHAVAHDRAGNRVAGEAAASAARRRHCSRWSRHPGSRTWGTARDAQPARRPGCQSSLCWR